MALQTLDALQRWRRRLRQQCRPARAVERGSGGDAHQGVGGVYKGHGWGLGEGGDVGGGVGGAAHGEAARSSGEGGGCSEKSEGRHAGEPPSEVREGGLELTEIAAAGIPGHAAAEGG